MKNTTAKPIFSGEDMIQSREDQNITANHEDMPHLGDEHIGKHVRLSGLGRITGIHDDGNGGKRVHFAIGRMKAGHPTEPDEDDMLAERMNARKGR